MYTEARHRHTVTEYLQLDRHADFRLEYWQGEIVAMAGESLAHVRICVNLAQVYQRVLE